MARHMQPLALSLTYANIYGVIYDKAALWIIDSCYESHLLMTPPWALSTEGAL